jgi:hypothetical protein
MQFCLNDTPVCTNMGTRFLNLKAIISVHIWGLQARLPALPDFWEVVGLERSPLRLLSTIEELLRRKRSGFGLENWDYCRTETAALATRHRLRRQAVMARWVYFARRIKRRSLLVYVSANITIYRSECTTILRVVLTMSEILCFVCRCVYFSYINLN